MLLKVIKVGDVINKNGNESPSILLMLRDEVGCSSIISAVFNKPNYNYFVSADDSKLFEHYVKFASSPCFYEAFRNLANQIYGTEGPVYEFCSGCREFAKYEADVGTKITPVAGADDE